MTKDEIILAKGDLVDKHVESAIQFRQFQTDYKFRVTAELIGRKAADISIEYAISVLYEVAEPEYQIISDGQCGVISIPQDSIYDKIKELKKLLK